MPAMGQRACASTQHATRSTQSAVEIFWCAYIGKIAFLVGSIYPAGKIGKEERIRFQARWAEALGKKGLDQGINLTIGVNTGDPMTDPEVLRPMIEGIESVGKRKLRIGGPNGYGVLVDVTVDRS